MCIYPQLDLLLALWITSFVVRSACYGWKLESGTLIMLEICYLCHIFAVVMVVTYNSKQGEKGRKGSHYEIIFLISYNLGFFLVVDFYNFVCLRRLCKDHLFKFIYF